MQSCMFKNKCQVSFKNFYFYFSELSDGIPVFDNDGLKIGDSQKAARKAVAQVLLSRIMLASPVMRKFLHLKLDTFKKRAFHISSSL